MTEIYTYYWEIDELPIHRYHTGQIYDHLCPRSSIVPWVDIIRIKKGTPTHSFILSSVGCSTCTVFLQRTTSLVGEFPQTRVVYSDKQAMKQDITFYTFVSVCFCFYVFCYFLKISVLFTAGWYCFPSLLYNLWHGRFGHDWRQCNQSIWIESIYKCVGWLSCLCDNFPMWKQRLPKKPQYMQKEDFEMEERSLLLTKEKLFSIYILIQYIWYQNICLKSWNASSKNQTIWSFFVVWRYPYNR